MPVRDRILDAATTAFRWLPVGRTTAHRSLWRLLGAPKQFVGRVNGAWFAVDALDTDISIPIYLWQEWELPASALWQSLLRPGQTVIDVGANKGWFSLVAAQRVGPQGRVVSYEPLPRNVRDLNATVAANGWAHMLVRPAGVSSRAGSAMLVSPDDESGTGWGSLEREAGDQGVSIPVETVALDDELDRLTIGSVDLLKMDIEGHELEALKGASRALATGRIKRLLVEVHANALGPARTAALHGLMEDAGYRAALLDESKHSEAKWRHLAAAGSAHLAGSLVVPIAAAVDPRLEGLRWYKMLWEHGSAR